VGNANKGSARDTEAKSENGQCIIRSGDSTDGFWQSFALLFCFDTQHRDDLVASETIYLYIAIEQHSQKAASFPGHPCVTPSDLKGTLQSYTLSSYNLRYEWVKSQPAGGRHSPISFAAQSTARNAALVPRRSDREPPAAITKATSN